VSPADERLFPAANFEFADLSKEDVPTGSHAYSEKLVLFLEHIYTSGLKKSEETAAKEMVVALATQKAEVRPDRALCKAV